MSFRPSDWISFSIWRLLHNWRLRKVLHLLLMGKDHPSSVWRSTSPLPPCSLQLSPPPPSFSRNVPARFSCLIPVGSLAPLALQCAGPGRRLVLPAQPSWRWWEGYKHTLPTPPFCSDHSGRPDESAADAGSAPNLQIRMTELEPCRRRIPELHIRKDNRPYIHKYRFNILLDHHMDNHVNIHVVIKNGRWWSWTDNYGYLVDIHMVIHLVWIWITCISTLDIQIDIQFGYPRYPNSGNKSVEFIRKSLFCMDMYGYV